MSAEKIYTAEGYRRVPTPSLASPNAIPDSAAPPSVPTLPRKGHCPKMPAALRPVLAVQGSRRRCWVPLEVCPAGSSNHRQGLSHGKSHGGTISWQEPIKHMGTYGQIDALARNNFLVRDV